jgi:hypothetical protein
VSAQEPVSPRQILAAIALAVDLPMPTNIHLYPNPAAMGSTVPVVAIDLDTLADGRAWSSHLGGDDAIHVNDANGRVYLRPGHMRWHGWSVQVHASEDRSEPVAVLDADTSALLLGLVDPS